MEDIEGGDGADNLRDGGDPGGVGGRERRARLSHTVDHYSDLAKYLNNVIFGFFKVRYPVIIKNEMDFFA